MIYYTKKAAEFDGDTIRSYGPPADLEEYYCGSDTVVFTTEEREDLDLEFESDTLTDEQLDSLLSRLDLDVTR